MFFERIAACKWAIDIWTHYILAILCIFHVFFYAALAHATGSNLIWVTLCRRVDKCRQGSSSSTCSSERLKQCTAAGTEECLSAHDTKGSEIDAGPHEAGAGKAKVRIWCSCRPLTKVTKWRHGCQTILQAAEATVWLVTHSWPGWQTKTNKQTETHEHTSIRAAPNRTMHKTYQKMLFRKESSAMSRADLRVWRNLGTQKPRHAVQYGLDHVLLHQSSYVPAHQG